MLWMLSIGGGGVLDPEVSGIAPRFASAMMSIFPARWTVVLGLALTGLFYEAAKATILYLAPGAS